MALAQSRAQRSDVGTTATWHYPGEGPTIVLVHGFRGDHHGLSAIAAALHDFNVVVPDLPGYGRSQVFAGKHDLDAYGRWLIQFLAELGGKPYVLGHSFGSLIVAKAHEIGLETAATVLLNPITTTASETFAGKLAAAFYKVGKLGRFGSHLLRSALVVRGMSVGMATTKDFGLRSFIHNQHLTYFSNYLEDRVAHEGFSAANSANVLNYAQRLPKRLLIIAGEKDIIAPLAGQLKLQRATGARLETLPVGHLTHYEAPTEVALLTREFIAAL
jgi:pimeloyl-ACP methyl ester carboxylesterase